MFILSILGILIFFYGLFEWNMAVYKPFDGSGHAEFKSVSILVPCRNEAKTIRSNVLSMLEQDYPDFEVIVLNDNSTDGTTEILAELIQTHSQRLRVIQGQSLPDGWQGKNFACHQLSVEAQKDWFLFVDADTYHEPLMLKNAMHTALNAKAALLSTFPRQRFGSWGDELVVPMMFFVLLTYLPMFFVSRRTWKWIGNISTACGQFILVQSKSYQEIGGHGDLRDRISEGPLLAKAIKSSGAKVILRDGSKWVSCHMYDGFREAFSGFSRSVFASMGGSMGAILFFFIFQSIVFVLPIILLLVALISFKSIGSIIILFAACLIPIWMRYRIHQRFGMSAKFIGLHSLSISLYHWIMLNSFTHYRIRKNTVWKGRSYASPKI
ncbi:MAG: chlorobactene glucosyltransferase [Candidatus Omnitrophota bacterium]|jgi:chlorobactene glucosyltransferase